MGNVIVDGRELTVCWFSRNIVYGSLLETTIPSMQSNQKLLVWKFPMKD
jgi:hypothetical protein